MSTPSKYSVPATSPHSQPLRSSIETEESDYAPTSTHSQQGDASEVAYEDHGATKEKETVQPIMGSVALQQLMATAPMTPEKGEKDRSRTAALIEMYREREKKAQTTPPASTSRLPVRSTSLDTLPKETALPPVLVVQSEPVVQSKPVVLPEPPVVLPEPVLVTPSDKAAEEPVAATGLHDEDPGRYVHGAPLHNVIEEEEEDANLAKRHPSRLPIEYI
ncbi:hypothetical protein M405DRAFT_847307 [Rhizopogon salebrosus TDB-379]|nr:hypothetical protein M405DRAFT_847307 [Rhizopogon salebrosus TDB-379]